MTDAVPAVRLRQAASVLRERAAAATPGPWLIREVPPYTDPVLMHDPCPGDADGNVLVVGSVDVGEAEQAWIALVHPGLAEPLAALLESAADREDRYRQWRTRHPLDDGEGPVDPEPDDEIVHAAAVADVILAGDDHA